MQYQYFQPLAPLFGSHCTHCPLHHHTSCFPVTTHNAKDGITTHTLLVCCQILPKQGAAELTSVSSVFMWRISFTLHHSHVPRIYCLYYITDIQNAHDYLSQVEKVSNFLTETNICLKRLSVSTLTIQQPAHIVLEHKKIPGHPHKAYKKHNLLWQELIKNPWLAPLEMKAGHLTLLNEIISCSSTICGGSRFLLPKNPRHIYS